MTKEQLIELIFKVLQSGRFEDFYKHELDDFISGESYALTEEQIKAKIKSVFNIRD